MKYTGKIGFAVMKNEGEGIYTEEIEEKVYYGDLLSSRWNNENNQNSPLVVNCFFVILNNSISVICDKYLSENISVIRYITYKNSKWCITGIEIQPPRIIINIGGIYNE